MSDWGSGPGLERLGVEWGWVLMEAWNPYTCDVRDD